MPLCTACQAREVLKEDRCRPFLFFRPCGKIVGLEKLQELKVSKEELGAVRKVAIFPIFFQ